MAKGEDGQAIKLEERANGSLIPSQSAVATVSLRQKNRSRRNWSSWILSNSARLAVWYSIYLILFSCPSDVKNLDANHSSLCKPYLAAKSFADPFVGPYYDRYASAYVEKARPYVATANDRVIRPATVLVVSNYNKYAAPLAAKAKDYTLLEWEKKGLPHWRQAQEAAQQAYDENLAVHVQKASEVASPYYESARENALNVREKHLIPAMLSSQPHLQKFYSVLQTFTLEKVVPFSHHAYTNLVIFVDGTLWPFLKKIYNDNVRPQLVMIGERIAKYQDGRKIQSAMEQVDTPDVTTSSFESGTTQSTSTRDPALSSSISSTPTSTTETASSTVVTTSAAVASEQSHVATDQTISNDLVKWQKKFAIAADKGTDALSERISDIVASIKRDDLGEGRGLANALEKTTEVELDIVRAKINSVAATLPENADDRVIAAAETEITQAVRHAGAQIKERARNVRAWADRFRYTLRQRTQLATDSTLQVLDDIRDLGLQEIGMRWAWMDGVTYKHWQKYHDLKQKFADWRAEVRETALSDILITEAEEQGNKLLEESMATTEAAARELVRLREVSKWKLAARDSSSDFDTRAAPILSAAASAASSIMGNVKEAVVGTSQGVIESLSSVAIEDSETVGETVSDLASSHTSRTTGSAESLLSEASQSAAAAASSVSSGASAALSDAASVIGVSSTGSAESLSSNLVDQISRLSSSGSSIAASDTPGPSDGILPSASSIIDHISSTTSSEFAIVSASSYLQDVADDARGHDAEATQLIAGEV